jgi:LPS-assembly lipoprotein
MASRGARLPTDARSRRRLLLCAGGAGAALGLLAGCGFQLRRPPSLAIQRLYLKGFAARSPMADELRRQLRVSPSLSVTETAGEAQVVLEALVDRRERVVAASTATGLVSELTLRARLQFRALTPDGRELIPATELLLSQDMSFSETAALAKEHEAELLYRAMQQDIVMQVLRRLAALPPL